MDESQSNTLDFYAISDDAAGGALCDIFWEFWPAYQKWIERSDTNDAGMCAGQIRAHMPELVGVFDRLVALFGGGDDVARFLSLYSPPRVVRACSQLVIDDDDGPVLIRSYDFHPDLFDGVVLWSSWTGTPTLAIMDCLWGALDGINAHGCAVALAFGGRNAVGPGFAAPLIVRYLLETCRDVRDARGALARLPVYMPYTFVVADSSGEFLTAYLGPDREPVFVSRRASTNHQGSVEWEAYCEQTQSEARLEALEALVDSTDAIGAARDAFVRAPLWRQDYSRGAGTLYVAEYRVAARELVLRWPGREERFGLDGFEPRRFSVDLDSV